MKKVIMKKGVCGSILMVLILSFLSSAAANMQITAVVKMLRHC